MKIPSVGTIITNKNRYFEEKCPRIYYVRLVSALWWDVLHLHGCFCLQVNYTHASIETHGVSHRVEWFIVMPRVTGPSPAKLVTC